MSKSLTGIFSVLFIIYVVIVVVNRIDLNQNCTGYLKRAADSNTMEMASAELGKALLYIESNNLTTGYTSILYKTPDEDLSFWYTNLKTTKNELDSLIAKEKSNQVVLSPVDRSNQLIKVRETLVDNGDQGGTVVTYPDGLYAYPNNTALALYGLLTLILASFCWLWVVVEY